MRIISGRVAGPGLVLASVLALGGCGQSTTAKHEKLVRCTGFSVALLKSDDGSTVRTDAGALLIKDGITEQDTIPMGAAAHDYAAKMDPARVATLSQEGGADANDLIARRDAAGIADYTKACVATFKSLGK